MPIPTAVIMQYAEERLIAQLNEVGVETPTFERELYEFKQACLAFARAEAATEVQRIVDKVRRGLYDG